MKVDSHKFFLLPLYIHAFRHLACTKQMHSTLSFLVPFLYMQFFPLSPLLAIGFLPPPPHICSPPIIYSCVQTSGVHQTNAQYTIISRAFSVHAIFPPLPSPCNWLFATTPPYLFPSLYIFMRSDIWRAPNKCTVHYHFSCLFCTCNFSPSPLSLQLAFCHHPPPPPAFLKATTLPKDFTLNFKLAFLKATTTTKHVHPPYTLLPHTSTLHSLYAHTLLGMRTESWKRGT